MKKVAHIKKETLTQVYFGELSKILKKSILKRTRKWLVLDFAQMPHLISHIIKRISKKGNHYCLNVFNRISTSENYRKKKLLDSKMQLFVIFSSKEHGLKSLIRAWELPWNEWMNEWMKISNLLWIRYKLATSK